MTKKIEKNCPKCTRDKSMDSFYNTFSPMFPDKKLNICKTCLKKMVDPNNEESVKTVLRQIDKPFIASVWKSCKEDQADNPFGNYMRQINSLPQFKLLTWNDSSFGESDAREYPQKPISTDQVVGKKEDGEIIRTPRKPVVVSEELFDKWGYAFHPEEVMAFENLFIELKNNYKLTTASHIEFLKLACISRVKSVNAMARGDTKEAKEYMSIFKDMTNAGKLQPSQFSKSDLSDGLDTFSQLVKRVEMSVDVIPILPRFLEQPKDRVDVCLWAYINHIRGLKNMPDVEYKDIWKWYDDRKDDYENNMSDSNLGAFSSNDDVEIEYDPEITDDVKDGESD